MCLQTQLCFYSLLGLVSYCFWEGDSGEEICTRWRCVEKINHSRDSLTCFEAYKPAFHIYRAILESFFYAYGAIVVNFVIVSFFLEKHYIRQYYRWLTCYICARLCQCFGQGGCSFGVLNRLPATATAHNVFCYSAVAHILNLSVDQVFRPKSGLKNKCRARAGFELVTWGSDRVQATNEALLQLCSAMYAGAYKRRLKGYIPHPPTGKIDWNHFVKQATLILGQMFLLLVRGYQWRFW